MGKITVKHYLNKAIKPRIEGNKELYPLYVQVIVNRTNYRFKSDYPYNDGYLQESDLMQDFTKSCIAVEQESIKKIVNFLIENNKNELITAEYINKCSENLWSVINRNFGVLFERESQVLIYNYPNSLVNRDFFDLEEIIMFMESEIEQKFSESYRDCRTAMDALKRSLFELEFEHLNIGKLTVFDFLHGNGLKVVLEAIKMHHYIGSPNPEEDYKKILEEINKLIFLD